MSRIEVDTLVLGWGKAGKTLAGALGRSGRDVALVERSPQMYGGTCINIACVPTKALIHDAASRRHGDDPQDWFGASVQRRDTLIGKLNARNHAMLAEVDAVTLIDGQARFVSAHEVEVSAGSDRLRVVADTIVVNTGSVPARPHIDGADHSTRVYDSTTLQHVHPLPRRLVIVGGGYVGLEFAGMFAGFGSSVCVIDRNETFMRREDGDVADAVRGLLEEQGVELLLGADVASIRDHSSGVGGPSTTVTVSCRQGPRALEADAVLVAAGRRPATTDLDLDAAGITTDDRGFIEVDEHLRTSAPGVFAVGDVNGGPQFTYISLDDYRIVLDQLTGQGRRRTGDRVAVPTTTFLTPPLARVGINETQARRLERPVLVGTKKVADIAAMPRPKILSETHGLVKVIVDAETDHILGATLFCVDAQDVINLVALAMRTGATAGQLRDGIWTHPSTTEAFNEVLTGLQPLT
jgi:pyruvate/2-oxoglutarate dehydrogenase complex dihydrolipoamide dehydrogenase (E3) component